MDTQNIYKLQTIVPGILSDVMSAVSVQHIDDVVCVAISPKKNETINLVVVLNQNHIEKKYSIDVNFNHEQAAVQILGLYQLHGKQTVDIQTVMNHAVPHCHSAQIWKGIIDDAAKAVFEGKIVVAPHAQKTNAQLFNKNLLLSSLAEANTKPMLEIYADDVMCSHGATVGFLDHDALFYLRSRGIAENDAKQLLIDAFANEILVKAGIST